VINKPKSGTKRGAGGKTGGKARGKDEAMKN